MSNHFVVFAYVSLHTYIPKAHETELKVLSSSLRPHSPRDGVVVASLMNGHGQASNITCDAPNAGKQALLFRLISIGFITCEDLDI